MFDSTFGFERPFELLLSPREEEVMAQLNKFEVLVLPVEVGVCTYLQSAKSFKQAEKRPCYHFRMFEPISSRLEVLIRTSIVSNSWILASIRARNVNLEFKRSILMGSSRNTIFVNLITIRMVTMKRFGFIYRRF